MNILIAMFNKLAVNRSSALIAFFSAIIVNICLVSIVTAINAEPLDALPFANLVFLMF